MLRLLPLVSFLALFATPASAQTGGFKSGNDLLSTCRNNRAACENYVMGVADMILVRQSTPGAAQHLCIPDHANSTQLADVVIRLLEERPQDRHWMAAVLVNNALIVAFPCARPQPPQR